MMSGMDLTVQGFDIGIIFSPVCIDDPGGDLVQISLCIGFFQAIFQIIGSHRISS